MTQFNVSYEINIIAENPLDAAKQANEIMVDSYPQLYVQNDETKKIFSVDLEEYDEKAVLLVNNYSPIIETKSSDIYSFCINNCKQSIKDSDKLSPDNIDAFRMSEVLAIAFCKTKEDVLKDLVF